MEAADGVLEDTGEAADAPDVTDEPEGVEDDHHDPRLTKARNEAKGLRARLREAEAERDGLRDSVTAMRRAEAVRLAAGTLSDGEDLFRDGLDLSDLLAENGTLDPGLVKAAAQRVAEAHPNWTPSRAVSELRPGQGETPDAASLWQDVLRGN